MARLTLWGMNNYLPLFTDIELPTSINKELVIDTIIDRSGMLFPWHQEPPRLKISITNWFARKYNDFAKMYEAMYADYNPIHNYDRTEEHTDTDQDSGTDTDTSQLSGTDTDTLTLSGQDKTTSAHTGDDSVSTVHGGTDTESPGTVVTTQVSAYNSADFTNRDKQTQSGQNSTGYGHTIDETTMYGDTTTDTTDYGKKDTRQTEYGKKDVNIRDYGKTTTRTGSLRAYGNIGVTTSQQMIESEMELRTHYDLYLAIQQLFEDEFLMQIY